MCRKLRSRWAGAEGAHPVAIYLADAGLPLLPAALVAGAGLLRERLQRPLHGSTRAG